MGKHKRSIGAYHKECYYQTTMALTLQHVIAVFPDVFHTVLILQTSTGAQAILCDVNGWLVVGHGYMPQKFFQTKPHQTTFTVRVCLWPELQPYVKKRQTIMSIACLLAGFSFFFNLVREGLEICYKNSKVHNYALIRFLSFAKSPLAVTQ